MKRLLRIAALPLVFTIAALLAHFEATPGNLAACEENVRPPGNPPQTQTSANPVDTTAVLRAMEIRMLAPNPPLPHRTYSGEKMERLHFYSSFGAGAGNEEYASDWARDEPEKMFAWLRETDGHLVAVARLLFDRWAEADLEAALVGALQLPDSTLRAQALLSTLESLARTNPERARRLLQENIGLYTPDTVEAIRFGYPSPESSWELVQSLPPGIERTRLEVRCLDSCENEAAVALWDQAPETRRREWLASGFSPHPWQSQAFDGFSEIMRTRAETTSNADDAKEFIRDHGASWAEQDFEAATKWTMTYCKGKAKSDSLESFYRTAIRQDPARTIQAWKRLPEGYLKKRLGKTLLENTPEENRAELEAAMKTE